ncbi:spinster family MFS transporter [Glaciibacter flavus]|uniref:spinster family MFS transporter n=1 Tax=Orlajensenia flava TaxID=2565934 RepID=UPI003AFFCA1A
MSDTRVTQPETKARVVSSAKWILTLLFIGNLLNFYDRAIPSVVLEQIKADFRLDDVQVGILASAFVLFGAIAGIPLGWLADKIARKQVAGWGLLVWSAFTALGGLLTNFWAFFGTRVGVGIGEASYTPATGSLISDLYPSEKRARANSLFLLGFPIGTLLAFFTVGGIAVAFDSWRAPFLIAAVPGVIVAILILLIKEPRRGAAEPDRLDALGAPAAATDRPAKSRAFAGLVRVGSLWGLVLAYAGYNFAAYAIGTFLTPVLQRYYGLELIPAALLGGVVIGITGLLGLIFGGRVLDRAAKSSPSRRVLIASISLVGAAVFSLVGLAAAQQNLWQLVVFLGIGYLLGIVYLAASLPAVSDVIGPRQRSTALGVVFAIGLLIGGAGGPIAVGAVSDSLATSAASSISSDAAIAQGLQGAMMIMVPIAFVVAAIGMFIATRFMTRDHEAMLAREAA